MDEARFGTHSKIGHGWFPTGSRSCVNMKLGFKNFYVYGAVEPSTGELFSLILPEANSDWMNLFLRELYQNYPNDKIVLVVDGAGWHKSKRLVIPRNIELMYLPPYTPEMNPVERLWLYIKSKTIRNKIYDSLEELEQTICDFINSISANTVASICSIS